MVWLSKNLIIIISIRVLSLSNLIYQTMRMRLLPFSFHYSFFHYSIMAVEILLMNVIALVPLVLAIAVSSTPASIFILAGQSNMAGQGGTFTAVGKWDGLTPPECQSNPHIFRLNDEHVSCSNNNGSSGIGPEMPFSNSLLKRDPSIGLVPCAVGGTGIREWSRGYNRLLNRTRASVSLAGSGGSLRAKLWYE